MKDIDEHSKCIDSDVDDEHFLEDQMNTLSINNNNSNSDNTMNYIVDCIFDLPEDIIINFICKYLDPTVLTVFFTWSCFESVFR